MPKNLYVAVSPAGNPVWESVCREQRECKDRLLNERSRSFLASWPDFEKRGWRIRKCKITLLKE